MRLAPIDHRADFDQPSGRPALRHLDRFVQVGDGDFRITADRLLALDERAVGDHRFAVVELDRGGGALRLKLVPARDLACIFAEPLIDRGVGRLLLSLWHRFPLLGAVLRLPEQQYVFHRAFLLEIPRQFAALYSTTNDDAAKSTSLQKPSIPSC